MDYSYLISSLDIGTTKICCLVAEITTGASLEILGVGITPCTGLRKGVVVDIASTVSAIRKAVEEAQKMAGERIDSVVVGITGEHIACLNSRSVVAITHPRREITEADLERALESSRTIVLPSDREIIHAIPRWYSVDGQRGIRAPIGMHGNRLEVETHVVTGVSTFLQNVLKCVHQAGLSVDGTVLEPVATGECVLLPAERELGVALADIGGGTSDVAAYIEGEIYFSGIVPVGGNHVTKDISVGLRTTIEEAERIKLNYGYAAIKFVGNDESFEFTSIGSNKVRRLPQKVLAEIIEPRAAEMCQLIGEQIEKAGCREKLSAGLVLTGGGALLRGLPELMSEVLGFPVRVGAPSNLTGHASAVSSPACSTAVGLLEFWRKYQDKQMDERRDGTVLFNILKRIREIFARINQD
ncbi:MAG: cell division protein FtsA [Armatimonadetes bacterium]|nr:cell division protein FtsA [Armatimonadota bacterium]